MGKNNKRSPLTIARQARFEAEEGCRSFHPSTLENELRALDAICGELIGIDTPEQKQARVAMESTAQGYTEGKANLDGSYSYDKASAPIYPNGLPVLHSPGIDCDVELDEIGASLVATTLGTNKNAPEANGDAGNGISEDSQTL